MDFEAAGSDFCPHGRISHRLRLIPRCAGHSRAPFLPPCSPDLNPIEHLWAAFKTRRRKNLPTARNPFLFIANVCLGYC
ncbi:MAG TPA: transposase [Candidatus Limnocylindrales bacterium]|nr:transposase [Candidatus Limnocylindrales bacterium]